MSRIVSAAKRFGDKTVNFWKTVAHEYRTAMNDVVEGCREKPFKATAIISLLGGSLYANRTNPTEVSFKANVVGYNNALAFVSDQTRNKQAQVKQCKQGVDESMCSTRLVHHLHYHFISTAY